MDDMAKRAYAMPGYCTIIILVEEYVAILLYISN